MSRSGRGGSREDGPREPQRPEEAGAPALLGPAGLGSAPVGRFEEDDKTSIDFRPDVDAPGDDEIGFDEDDGGTVAESVPAALAPSSGPHDGGEADGESPGPTATGPIAGGPTPALQLDPVLPSKPLHGMRTRSQAVDPEVREAFGTSRPPPPSPPSPTGRWVSVGLGIFVAALVGLFIFGASQRSTEEFGREYQQAARTQVEREAHQARSTRRMARPSTEGGRKGPSGSGPPSSRDADRRIVFEPRPKGPRTGARAAPVITPEQVGRLYERTGGLIPKGKTSRIPRYGDEPTVPVPSSPGLSVKTVPTRATVYFDGVRVGRSPLYRPMAEAGGSHTVEIELAGYERLSLAVLPDEHGQYVVERVLKPVTVSP